MDQTLPCLLRNPKYKPFMAPSSTEPHEHTDDIVNPRVR